MNIAIKADNPLEAVALSSGLFPSGAILPVLSIGVSSILITAMRLNVFDHLQNTPMTIAKLATATNCNVFGIEV